MAFGRSNSLSINTGATNSLFASQQQNNASSQPPAPGGLFGSSTQQSTQAGSLFGGAAAQQQQTGGGGSFGNTTSQPQQTGGLFGSSTAQPQQSGGLFGGTQNNAQGTQQGGGSLFGSSLNQQISQQQSGGLFGSAQNQPAQQPQQQSGSLFDGLNQSTQQQSGSLFGNMQNKPTSLFGASTSNAPQFNTSIFSNTQQQQNQQQQQQQQQQQAPQNSIFGLSAQQPPAPTSLLNASQYRGSQYQPFAGKLTMGQTAAPSGPQQPAQGAVKINYEEMRPTTRYADCTDDVKFQLEQVDKMIQNQERFCREIEAFIPKHGQNIASLAPDVELVKEKTDAAEGSLAVDAGGVESQRKILENDRKDFQRCERVVMNLAQPLQYRYTGNYGGAQSSYPAGGAEGDVSRDMDLIGNYFVPMAADFKMTLDTYASNLAEIEGHMRVIEHSTVVQAQQLAARRAGSTGGGRASADETVRELADTLRGFEASILGAAGLVGQAREGVNELVLGRLGGGVSRR